MKERKEQTTTNNNITSTADVNDFEKKIIAIFRDFIDPDAGPQEIFYRYCTSVKTDSVEYAVECWARKRVWHSFKFEADIFGCLQGGYYVDWKKVTRDLLRYNLDAVTIEDDCGPCVYLFRRN